jgi:cytochrome oxidase Cu insertion factor (SCO1/SenC/PrrC family)
VAQARFVALGLSALLVLTAACDGASGPEGGERFLSEGDRAPTFTLPSASGEQVSLADYQDHRPVLLYFSMGPG